VSPAAAALTEPAAYRNALLNGNAHLAVPHLTFDYFSLSELMTSLATLLAGLLLAWWYVRRAREPRPVRALRVLHTGSVNDYALFATTGILASITVMVAR
jgi:multicomponent Na+:H+ antiporter subunit D